MSDKVLKVWWRYLTYFLSYREYSRGGQNLPPSGARVDFYARIRCVGEQMFPNINDDDITVQSF